jgi:hypothetical protein
MPVTATPPAIRCHKARAQRIRKLSASITFCVCVATLAPAAFGKPLKVLSEKTVTGFGHVESVGYDSQAKIFYTSDFGPALKPADKDGKGKITKFTLHGKVLEDGFLPPGGTVMDKPKGIWIANGYLWVTDIDSVWQFDLETKKGKNLPLPGVTFANDTVILEGALYVSDNRSDKLVRIEPADFLNAKSPKITEVFSGRNIHPNGLWPAKDGSLLMVGSTKEGKRSGIWSMRPGQEPKEIDSPIGLLEGLDGVYQTKDGTLLATDWESGSLFSWSKNRGMQKLATGFSGPADFAAAPNDKGLLVAVPDLVNGQIRLIQLGR